MRKRKSTSVKKRVLSGLTAFLVAAANLNCGIGSSSFVQQVVADETQAQTSEEEFESEVEITEAEPVTEEQTTQAQPQAAAQTAEAESETQPQITASEPESEAETTEAESEMQPQTTVSESGSEVETTKAESETQPRTTVSESGSETDMQTAEAESEIEEQTTQPESEEETETEMETETEPQTQMQTIEAADVKRVYSYEDDKISVVAVLQYADAVPDDAEFCVTPIVSGSTYDVYMEALNANSGVIAENSGSQLQQEYTSDNTLLYDIAFMVEKTDEDGNVIEGVMTEYDPAEGSVAITITFKKSQLSDDLGVEDASEIAVVHMPLTQEAKQ